MQRVEVIKAVNNKFTITLNFEPRQTIKIARHNGGAVCS